MSNEQEEIKTVENPSKPEEVFDGRSAAEIEAELMFKAEQSAIDAASSISPADRAAMVFQQLYPQFKRNISGLSRKEMERVLLSVVAYPLEPSDEPKSFNARQSMGIGLHLVDAKLIMRETIAIEEMKNLDNKENSCDNSEEAKALADSAETTFTMGEE